MNEETFLPSATGVLNPAIAVPKVVDSGNDVVGLVGVGDDWHVVASPGGELELATLLVVVGEACGQDMISNFDVQALVEELAMNLTRSLRSQKTFLSIQGIFNDDTYRILLEAIRLLNDDVANPHSVAIY